MTCKQLIESLHEYLETRLSLSKRFAFVLHLLCCGHCRAYLSNYKTTIAASQRAFVKLEEAPATPEVSDDFVQAVLKARNESKDS